MKGSNIHQYMMVGKWTHWGLYPESLASATQVPHRLEPVLETPEMRKWVLKKEKKVNMGKFKGERFPYPPPPFFSRQPLKKLYTSGTTLAHSIFDLEKSTNIFNQNFIRGLKSEHSVMVHESKNVRT